MCSQWLILLFSLTFASIGVAQTPTRNPEVPPVSKSNGSQVAQQHKETQHNEYQSKGKSTLVNKSAADDKSDGSNTNEDVGRSLAQFTFWLVIVGGLQFAVLLLQFFVLRHHGNLIGRSIDQMRQAVETYRAYVQVGQEENVLIRESNEITQRATELTRQSILLTHRPKLIVRRVWVPDHEVKDAKTRNLDPRLQEGVVPHGHFYVANVGESVATVRRHYSEILRAERLLMLPMKTSEEGIEPRDGNWTIAAVASEPIKCTTVGYPALHSMQRVNDGWEHIWLLGWIEYIDELNVTRRTDFCRRWDPTKQRFSPVDDPDYEHAP